MSATAWLLRSERTLAAVGEFELVHLLEQFPLWKVPRARLGLEYVVLWQEHVVPVVDLVKWLALGQRTQKPAYLGIVAYRPGPARAVHYGGILLDALPVRHAVDDAAAVSIDALGHNWHRAIHAGFRGETTGVVPVLDLARVFA